jgi:hypothetical protein
MEGRYRLLGWVAIAEEIRQDQSFLQATAFMFATLIHYKILALDSKRVSLSVFLLPKNQSRQLLKLYVIINYLSSLWRNDCRIAGYSQVTQLPFVLRAQH